MAAETATGWWTTQARESLGHAAQTAGCELPGLEDDRGEASAEVLDELAELVDLIAATTTTALGRTDPTVQRLSAQLRDALTAHRNLQSRT